MSKSTKTLLIVRHAKSTWEYINISDFDRPLKQRGIEDAYEMARRLKINRIFPGMIFSSPANRALHTATIFSRILETDIQNFHLVNDLYGCGSRKVMEVIKKCPDTINTLMIFGHNPDFSDLATVFSGSGYIEIPTCGIAKFEFESDTWQNISVSNKVSEILDFPHRLNE